MLCTESTAECKLFILNSDSQRTTPSCSTVYWLTDSWNDVLLNRSAAQYYINYFDNHYLTAVLGNDRNAFQIHVFREVAAVFDGEYCTFLRIYNLYSHETSCNVVKKATRCWSLFILFKNFNSIIYMKWIKSLLIYLSKHFYYCIDSNFMIILILILSFEIKSYKII